MTGHFDASDDDESDDGRQPEKNIRLIIHCPLIIKGDNNLVALDPSVQASKISMQVVESMQQLSHGRDGLPMIDEDGRPRPIEVQIHAEITIDGARNVIGEKAVLGSMTGMNAKRKAEEGKNVKEVQVRKRERDDNELVEVDAKRAKNE
jgi:hypothetical protein